MPISETAMGDPRRQRVLVSLCFLINGTAMGLFATQIPAIQHRLDLSAGSIGLALVALAAGSVLAIPLSGVLIERAGGRLITAIALEVLCLSLLLVALSPSLAFLAASLFVLGASNATVDVAINALGVGVERLYERPILSSFHGWYSVGGIVGSAATIVAASAAISSRPRLVAGAVFLGLSALTVVGLLPVLETEVSRTWVWPRRPTRTLVLLGAVAFGCLLGEGAAADWSGLLIRNVKLGSEAEAAAGFLVFSMAMATGRLGALRLIERLGAPLFVRSAGALAAAGIALAVLAPNPFLSVVGFAGLGLGLSCIFPLVLSRAGQTEEPTPQALATVTLAGYAGFVAGPALIGFLAQLGSLPAALLLVVVACAGVSVLAPVLRTRARDSGP